MSTILTKLKASLLDSKHREDVKKQQILENADLKADLDNFESLDKLKFNYSKNMSGIKISIDHVRYRYKLLTEIYQGNQIKLVDLAEELDVKKTDLMQFILDNKNYFALTMVTTAAGLVISKIYDKLEDNPITQEWLQKKINDNKKTIWMSPIKEFNNLMGWCLCETTKDPDPSVFLNENRATKWKNTKEKLEEVKKLGFLHKQQFYFGPYNERKSRIFDNSILDAEKADIVEKFKSAGWSVVFEK